jgi:hypothetical protein
MTSLSSLQNVQDNIPLGPLNDLLDQLFADFFEHIQITSFFETQEQGVSTYNMVLAVEQSVFFNVPGLNALSLGVFRDSADQWPLILCELVHAGEPIGVTLRHFPLRIIIENTLLLPVPADNEQDALAGFAFEVEGTLGIDAQLNISAEMELFSVPPFSIAGTGLVLGLQDCRLITNADAVDTDITDLGFNQSFRGIHAQSAQFYWDIPLQLNAQELPGIQADLENLALGNQGLSVSASLTWTVVDDGENIDIAQSELAGSLFAQNLQFALQQLDVVVAANIPIGTHVKGILKLPYIEGLFAAELGFVYAGENQYHYEIGLSAHSPLRIPLLHPSQILTLSELQLLGELDSDGDFELKGTTSISLEVDGLSLQADNLEIQFEHQQGQDNLLIKLENINIDGLAQINQAQLVLVFIDNEDEPNQSQLAIFELVIEMQWQDIASRINLAQQSNFLPMPADDPQVSLNISWHEEHMALAIQAELDDVDQLWRFIPPSLRPEVDDASIDIQLTKNGADFDGELSLGLLLRLPDLANLQQLEVLGLHDFIELNSGDEDGWMQLQFKAEIHTSDTGTGTDTDTEADSDSTKLSASIANPLSLHLQLPGLLLPDAPIEIVIEKIELNLSDADDELSGQFTLSGSFVLHPVLPEQLSGFVPPMIAQQLNRLLAIASQIDLSGQASLTLGFNPDNIWFNAECVFDQAGLELDLFDMLADLLKGGASLVGAENNATEIDLDIDVSVELKKITLSMGEENPAADQPLAFAFSINTELGFAGQFVELEFELSEQSLSFGFNELTIPIAIPKLPLSLNDLNRLKDDNGSWDYPNRWLQNLEPEIAAEINRLDQELEEARDLLQQLEQANEDTQAIFMQKFRVIPSIQADLLQFVGRKFLYEAVLAVHQMLGIVGVQGSQKIYQTGIEIYQGAVDVSLGWLHMDTQLQFKITDAKFVLPFNNPSDMRVEGAASIIGFAPDDPLVAMADLVFKLGISADAIYFALEGGVNPIPLPDFGHYPGSSVNLDRLVFGYGYLKNSLLIDFAGELILSQQLIEDADTSNELGFGLRLPVNNKLQFKLDLIPVTLGEVDFVIPLIGFDIDLRSDIPPPAPPMHGLCQPAWDGLQLIVPGAIRADLKRFKVSPFFGPVMSTNITTSFDFALGNADYGISHICENYFTILPMTGAPTMPMLNDASPYFDRYCTRINLGGFGLSFDLSRPFPHPSPLLIFELMGFIADPSVPIDPNGHIANIMYAELFNGQISLPAPVAQMFPVLNGVVNTDFSGKINVATIIALAQQIQSTLAEVLQRISDTSLQGIEWAQSMLSQPPQLSLSSILALLPAPLRKVELHGRFVFFDASATFMLMQAQELAQLADNKNDIDPATPLYELLYHNDFHNNDLSDWQVQDFGMKRGKGMWLVDSGRLVQANNVGDNSPARYGTMLIYMPRVVEDLKLEVQLTSQDNDGLGLVFHFQNKDTFYRFRMTQEQKQWDLVKLVDGRATTLFVSKTAFKPNKTYQIRLETSSRSNTTAGLSRRFSNKTTLKAINIRASSLQDMLQNMSKSEDITSIKIWVDGQLWCAVQDNQHALTQGRVGLDSWWDQGAQFDDFVLYQKKSTQLAMGSAISSAQLLPLANQLSPDQSGLMDEFVGFSQADISAAMASGSEFALAVVAKVNVIDSQIYSMLGSINSNGEFSLFSSLDIEPLSLRVAGIELSLPLQLHGRLQLQGRSAGADSFARINASVYADWIILPNGSPQNAIARLLIADQQQPASLMLSSNPDFALQGSGELRLFAEQIVIKGHVDISQEHVILAGQLEFEPAITVFENTPLMALHLSCEGRIGPQQLIALEGLGQLQLLGKSFTQVSGSIGYKKMQLSAQLNGNNQSWQLGLLPLTNVQMRLAGMVDFSSQNPQFALSGEGKFTVLGAGIEGQCSVKASGQNWMLGAEGQLFWQGRNWLDGGISIGSNGVTIQGNADFGLDLTPQQLPANIEIAGLHLNAAVSGKFSLNAQGQLLSWQFDLNWQLAIKLPGMQANQMLPIASQQINLHNSHSASEDMIVLFDLIAINGLNLFDLGSITVSVPVLDTEKGDAIYLHNSVNLDVDGDGFNFSYLTPVKPSPSSEPVFNFIIQVYEDDIDVDVPEVTMPIPVLSSNPMYSTQAPLFRVPEISPSELSLDLGQLRLDLLQLHLQLVWKNDELGIWLEEKELFVSFSSFASVQIVTISGFRGT